jgi:iron complex transport system substrate-binding protein
VSYSPAITEILFDMGLGDHIVGVTGQDILPPGQTRQVVGDRFQVYTESILAAEPELLLIQQDPKDFQATRRMRPQLAIESIRLESLADIATTIDRLGELTRRPDLAVRVKGDFQAALDAVRKRVGGLPRPRVLFTTDYERPFVAAGGTFVHDLIELAGGRNVGVDIPGQTVWRSATVEGILKAAPDVLICQVEPGREAAAIEYWRKLPGLPAARDKRIYAVADRHWSIPSTRLAGIARQLADMIHPEAKQDAGSP